MTNECVAQLVEHLTFNQRAQGSNPCTLTILNKSSKRRLFFIFKGFSRFDWTQHKKHYFFINNRIRLNLTSLPKRIKSEERNYFYSGNGGETYG